MPLWQRAVLGPAIVAMFWPDLGTEIAGAVAAVAILALNRGASRRDGPAQPAG
jgi:hypothetical protein